MSQAEGTQSATITKKTLTKQEKVVTIEYPQVSVPDRAAARRINGQILDSVYELIRKQGYLSKDITEMVGKYEEKLNAHGLLSLILNNYAIWKDAAHGITFQVSPTFDLNTGEVIPLADLFRSGSDYRTQLSNLIKEQIKERDIQLINKFTIIAPNQSYYLTENELVLYFQIYEYTPYYYGFPTFPIPYKQIANLIDPNGPLRFALNPN